MNQLACIATLIHYISSTAGSFQCTNDVGQQAIICVNLIAASTCRARYLSFCIKRDLIPAEVERLFGCLQPSRGHAMRICRILRSENWRQVRLYYDYLKVLCLHDVVATLGTRRHREHLRLVSQATEFLWQRVRPGLPRRPRAPAQRQGGLTVLGDVQLPSEVSKILEKGPKYSLEPRLAPHELLAVVRRVSERADADDRDRCVLEGVDCLMRSSRGSYSRGGRSLGRVVSFLQENRLNLLQADKEGGFVVLPEGMFGTRSRAAISKNFLAMSPDPKKVKSAALRLCAGLELHSLEREIKKSKVGHLEAFFTVKTHKEGSPFRTIVTERGTWQRSVSQYLLGQLASLRLSDPFLVRNSQEVVDYLRTGTLTNTTAFSIDVVDLFYSIPHGGLFTSVRDCIENRGVVGFQNASGVGVDSFLELLRFYLQSTFILFDGVYYLQRQGICIGACVAPVLCDIFLAKIDKTISENLDSSLVTKVFRYVDDYLVMINRPEGNSGDIVVNSVLDVFTRHSGGLKFTHERQNGLFLQYLDLKMKFTERHVCWLYHPRTKKGLLPFDSAHSKLVKRSIASSCLQAALAKSCPHTLQESFEKQIDRLSSAGFPATVLLAVAEKLLRKVKTGPQQPRDRPNRRPQVIPYLHKVSHNLKKIAGRYDVPVVFSAPCKMLQLCPRVADRGTGRNRCSVKHRNKYVECAMGVVYRIPLSCGRVYIGQTGRCVNDRAREHALSLRSTSGGHLPLHCSTCSCEPIFDRISILGRGADKTARELLEAFEIGKEGDQCVSQTSIFLLKREVAFLSTF